MNAWLAAQGDALTRLEPKDWIALVLAALALIVSLAVAAYTVRSDTQKAKMATYERIHEQLVHPQTATGRRAIFLHAPDSSFPTSRTALHDEACDCGELPDLWDVMNQAVAWYDTLATYFRQREVPRRVVLRAWYHPLVAIRPHIYRFLDHRARQGIEQPWDALQSLLEVAVWYRCKCRTCMNGNRPDPQLRADLYECECEGCRGRPRMHPAYTSTSPWWLTLTHSIRLSRARSRSRAGVVHNPNNEELPHRRAAAIPTSPDLPVHFRA